MQFTDVLKALKSDVRSDLRTTFAELAGTQGNGGADALRRSLNSQPAAYKFSAIVSEALLGEKPGDLGRWFKGQATVADAREQADTERQKFIEQCDLAEREANGQLEKEVGDFERKIKELEASGDADPQAAMQMMQQLAAKRALAQRRLETKTEQLTRQRDIEMEKVERQLGAKVRQEQDRQKWLAVLLPPIPPLVVAFFVYFRRRAQEREGVAKTRLR